MTPYEQLCVDHNVDPKTTLWRVAVRSGVGALSWGSDLDGYIVQLYHDEKDRAPRMRLIFPGSSPPLPLRWVNIAYLEPLQPTGDTPCEP